MKKVSLVVLLAFLAAAVFGFTFSVKAASLTAGGTVKDGGTAEKKEGEKKLEAAGGTVKDGGTAEKKEGEKK
jgi:hypothetical protein